MPEPPQDCPGYLATCPFSPPNPRYVCDRLLSASVDYEESGWWVGVVRERFGTTCQGDEGAVLQELKGKKGGAWERLLPHVKPLNRCDTHGTAQTAPIPLPCVPLLDRPCRYDGQVFVKPPEVLTRDRLLGM